MNKWMNITAAVLVAMSLAACSDDDDDAGDAGGGPVTGSADLSDPATVRAQAGSLAQLISGIDSIGTAVGVDAQRKTLENGECDSGSMSEFSETGKAVGSPFTAATFDVAGEVADNCRLNANIDGGETANDYLVIDGRTEAGQVTDGDAEVFYASVGESTSAPYSFAYHVDTEQQGNVVVLDIDYGFFVRVDESSNETVGEFDERLQFNIDGDYSVDTTANGQNVTATGSFNSFLGHADAPFRLFTDASGSYIDGPFGFSITPQVPDSGCANAQSEIATTDALVESAGSSVSPFASGTIEISSGGSAATVTFNSDDTVTLTPDGGSSETVNYTDLLASAGACSGFAFAGIAFLGSL